MNGLQEFCRRHHFTVRDLSEICGGPQHPKSGVGVATAHRLLNDELNVEYRLQIEPVVIHSLRSYLRLKGMTEEEIIREVPDSGFFSPIPQITREIKVPDDCCSSYVFKDPRGKLLSIVVFDQRA